MRQTTIYDFIDEQSSSLDLVRLIQNDLTANNNKLSPNLINLVVSYSTIRYHHLTPNMRACTITLPTGHEVIGIAQVLDTTNDIESIGNEIAFTRAKNELWPVLGTIAKVLL